MDSWGVVVRNWGVGFMLGVGWGMYEWLFSFQGVVIDGMYIDSSS